MRLLAFDTQGPLLSAVAAEGCAVVVERAEAAERGQADRILPLLEEVLALAGWGWRSVELLAVTVGPGSFTAIRTGIAAARALALALDRPAIGIGTLEAMAEAAVDLAGPGPLLVLKDLRREQLAAQSFAPDLVPEAEPGCSGGTRRWLRPRRRPGSPATVPCSCARSYRRRTRSLRPLRRPVTVCARHGGG